MNKKTVAYQKTQITSKYNPHHTSIFFKITPSLPYLPIEAEAIAILCGEIILPAVAPTMFEATTQFELTPKVFAADNCKLPNKTLAEVSVPVMKVPNAPIKGAING